LEKLVKVGMFVTIELLADNYLFILAAIFLRVLLFFAAACLLCKRICPLVLHGTIVLINADAEGIEHHHKK
jgi:hypothetical protein